MEHQIKYQPVKLSDGSCVYDLIIGTAKFSVVSQQDADLFANGFRALVERHTKDTTREIYMEPIAA